MRYLVLITVLLFSACGKAKDAASASETAGNTFSIASNKRINAYTTNMCTQFAGDNCAFLGGQLLKFSDGSVQITGGWGFQYTSGGGTDTDTDQNTVTLTFPASTTSGYLTLSQFVARGSGYKAIYLVWDRSSDGLILVHDTNGNATPDGSDTVITTLSTSSW